MSTTRFSNNRFGLKLLTVCQALKTSRYVYFTYFVCLNYTIPPISLLFIYQLKSSWAGYYDYNTLDHNAIIGHHPYHQNLIFVTGFSGHGIQQATAAGRAAMELIIDGSFQTIDLNRFSFNRIIQKQPIFEQNIV